MTLTDEPWLQPYLKNVSGKIYRPQW